MSQPTSALDTYRAAAVLTTLGRLWRMVRPGGTLAVTIWGPELFEPAATLFWGAVRAYRPELERAPRPWDAVTEADALEDLLAAAGIREAVCEAEPGWHPIATPEDWWAIVLGSGFRGTVDRLRSNEAAAVRAHCLSSLRTIGTRALRTDVVYGLARKPGAPA